MSTFGKRIQISLFGESHGKYIGLTVHNFPCNIKIDIDKIKRKLELRRAFNTSGRKEEDEFEIISGFFNNVTTGAPLTFLIKNNDVKSNAYFENYGILRPSHADLSAYVNYDGVNDFRGSGHLSGRLTTPLIILGSICEDALKENNIIIASRIKSIKDIEDTDEVITKELLTTIKDEVFPVFSGDVKKEMIDLISKTKEEKDSLGGVIETFIYNPGFQRGEPYFDSMESIISHLMFSIPGVKGIEFGEGFNLSKLYGSEAAEKVVYEDEKLVFVTNKSGGIDGGMTNSNYINFKVAIKPTPSIGKKLSTIDFINKKNTSLELKGRHDTIILIKALQVVNALSWYIMLETKKWLKTREKS